METKATTETKATMDMKATNAMLAAGAKGLVGTKAGAGNRAARNETLYRTEISLCAGISVGPQDSEPWDLRREAGSRQASRLVILSADAPEWALVALRPNAGPAGAMAALR